MGSVVQRDGKYRAMVRWVGHQSMSKTFETAKEAKKWIRQIESDLEAKDVRSPDVELTHLIDEYVREIYPKRKMADSHIEHDIPSIRRKFEGMTMYQLYGRGLIEWVLREVPERTAPSTAHWHIARLCGVLRQCEFHWGITVPWDDIEKAKKKLMDGGYLALPKERSRRVSDDEIIEIRKHLPRALKLNAADLIDFSIATAMRIGEVCRIRWSDLNEKSSTILIRDRKHPKAKFGNDQVVPLLGDSLKIIQRQPKRSERIWPHSPLYVTRVFRNAVVKAKIEDMVLHDLRHEGISRLFEKGFQIQEVALVSGHRDWKALRRYTHLRAEALVAKERLLAS